MHFKVMSCQPNAFASPMLIGNLKPKIIFSHVRFIASWNFFQKFEICFGTDRHVLIIFPENYGLKNENPLSVSFFWISCCFRLIVDKFGHFDFGNLDLILHWKQRWKLCLEHTNSHVVIQKLCLQSFSKIVLMLII